MDSLRFFGHANNGVFVYRCFWRVEIGSMAAYHAPIHYRTANNRIIMGAHSIISSISKMRNSIGLKTAKT